MKLTTSNQSKYQFLNTDLMSYSSLEAAIKENPTRTQVLVNFYCNKRNKEIWYQAENLETWSRLNPHQINPCQYSDIISLYLFESNILCENKSNPLKLLDSITHDNFNVPLFNKSHAFTYILATNTPKIRPKDLFDRMLAITKLLLKGMKKRDKERTPFLIHQLYQTIYLSFPIPADTRLSTIVSELEAATTNMNHILKEKTILLIKTLEYSQNKLFFLESIPKSALDTKLGFLLKAELYHSGTNITTKNRHLAKENYKLTLNKDANCFIALRRLGEIKMAKTHNTTSLSKAEKYFALAQNIFKYSKQNLINLSSVYFDMRKYERAQEYLDQALKLTPLDSNTVNFTITFATHYVENVELATAKKYLDILLKHNPSHEPTHNLAIALAKEYLNNNKVTQAKEYTDLIQQLDPLNAQVMNLVIKIDDRSESDISDAEWSSFEYERI